MRFTYTRGAKIALVLTLAVLPLALSGVALGGGDNQNLCAKNWQTVQNATGGSFASLAECASSRGVFAPSVTMFQPSPAEIVVQGEGFHASTTIYFAFYVDHPIQVFRGTTDADGSFVLNLPWSGCSDPTVHYDLAVTVTDSFGVHASARMPLC